MRTYGIKFTFFRLLLVVVSFINMKSSRGFQNLPRTRLFSNRFSNNSKLQNSEIIKCKMNKVSIEYCIGCRWIHRAHWMSTELLTTFNDNSILSEVSLRPSSTAGTFKILLNENTILFDREEQKRFPELKEVKQKIRNIIDPQKELGHSDSTTEETTEESHWVEYMDDEGTPYYYNTVTGESSWFNNGIEPPNEE